MSLLLILAIIPVALLTLALFAVFVTTVLFESFFV
jgi:hypothetical protein